MIRLLGTCLTGVLHGLFSRWAVVLVGLFVVAILLIPWKTAEPRVYSGFDPGLMFVDADAGEAAGEVVLNEDALEIEARPGSQPVAHVVASAAGFSSEFTATVSDRTALNEWRLVQTTVTAPEESASFSLLIGAVGGDLLIDDIAVTSPSAEGSSVSLHEDFEDDIDNWSFGSGARLIDSDDGSRALRIAASEYKERGAWSSPLALDQEADGRTFHVSALIRVLGGDPKFKLSVEWLDRELQHLAFSPDWVNWQAYNVPAVPMSVKLWHPSDGRAVNLVFGGGEDSASIVAFTSAPDGASPEQVLAPFKLGDSYDVRMEWEPGGDGRVAVTAPSGETKTYEGSEDSGLTISESPLMNLSFQASAPLGAESRVTVESFQLEVPASSRLFHYADDWRLIVATLLVVAWLGGYIAFSYATVVRSLKAAAQRFAHFAGGVSARVVAVAVFGTCLLLAGYAMIATADAHPFDRLSQESWMYVIDQYGADDLYARTSAIPDSEVRGDSASWSAAEMAYPPGIVYFYAAQAEIADILVPGDTSPMDSRAFLVAWKMGFGLMLLVVAGAALYAMRRVVGTRMPHAVAASVLLALNPALLFDALAWGQADSLLISGLLLATIGLMTDNPRPGWAAFGFSLLIKQTALPLIPIFLVIGISRYGWRRSLEDISFGAIVVFTVMSPLVLAGYHPATFYLSTVGKLFDFASPVTAFTSELSADTFPAWSLLTGLAGETGLGRIHASDADTVPLLGLSYLRSGQLITALTILFAMAVVGKAARSTKDARLVFLAIGLLYLVYVTFGTRTSGRYLTLALPFLFIGTSGENQHRWWPLLAGITFVSLLSQYGLFMHIASRGEWPAFHILGHPSNGLGEIVYWLYTSDVLITFYASWLLASTGVLVWHIARRAVPRGIMRTRRQAAPVRQFY